MKFTLYMIRKELRDRGKTRSLQEIRQSLEILSRSVYEVEIEGKGSRRLVYTNPILNDLSRGTREDYLDDPKNMWLARLPVLVSQSINDLIKLGMNAAGKDAARFGWLVNLSRHVADAELIVVMMISARTSHQRIRMTRSLRQETLHLLTAHGSKRWVQAL